MADPDQADDAGVRSAHEAAEFEESDCPTPTAHARLREAHKHWHDALAGYQDPEQFRIALNACIQTLRNVTWALQKEKRLIPDFDAWYAPWQERMGQDFIMRWLLTARTRIVHQGDLETHSTATVRFTTDYFAAAVEVEATMAGADRAEEPESPTERGEPGTADEDAEAVTASSPFLALGEIIEEFFSNKDIPHAIRSDTSVSIERSWIADDLPSIELLDALAHGYGVLSQILNDAHQRVGRIVGVSFKGADRLVSTNELHAGRLPCLVTSRAARTVTFASDGRTDGGRAFDFEGPDREKGEAALKRYKPKQVVLKTYPMNAVDALPIYISQGLSILRSGEEHGWYVFYFRGRRMFHIQTLYARNRSDKRGLAKEVAEFVAVHTIDGVIVVGESWWVPWEVDSENVPIDPSKSEARKEALVFHAEIASGASKTVVIPFRRRRYGRPVIDEPREDRADYYFLEPVRSVWRLMGLRGEANEDSADPSTEDAGTIDEAPNPGAGPVEEE